MVHHQTSDNGNTGPVEGDKTPATPESAVHEAYEAPAAATQDVNALVASTWFGKDALSGKLTEDHTSRMTIEELQQAQAITAHALNEHTAKYAPMVKSQVALSTLVEHDLKPA